MFGRSNDITSPAAAVDESGGRTAAISILPGVPLPHDLAWSPAAPAAPAPPAGGFFDDHDAAPAEAEHALVGAGVGATTDGAHVPGPAFGVGTSTPPAFVEEPGEAPAKKKRGSFSGLRRRKGASDPVVDATAEPVESTEAAPAATVEPTEPAALTELTELTEPTEPTEPTAPAAPVGEAHILTEVHVVAEAPEPFDIQAELAAEAAEHGKVAHAAPAFPSSPVFSVESTETAPVEAPQAESAVPAAFVPAAADEDPLFHHVPVHAVGAVTTEPGDAPAEVVATEPAEVEPVATQRVSFVDRLRALRPSAHSPAPDSVEDDWPRSTVAPVAAPVAVAAPVVEAAAAPAPYIAPEPSAPVDAAPVDAAPSFVPLGTPTDAAADVPAAPPIEAPAQTSAVPSFAHLVPTQPVGFPAESDALAAHVADQVAAERADEAPVDDEAAPAPAATPTIGLVFADGTHAELEDGPEGAALQHVARVLASDDTASGNEGSDQA